MSQFGDIPGKSVGNMESAKVSKCGRSKKCSFIKII